MGNVEEFIDEYEMLCRTHGLTIYACTDGTMGIFRLDCENNMVGFDATLDRWRAENGANKGD